MKDIFDIKSFTFSTIIDEKFKIYFSIILGILIFLLLLFIIYRKFREKLKLIEESEYRKRKLKEKYLKLINSIKLNDPERVFKLNLYVRSYLEKAGIIEKPTKKTKNELKISGNEKLDDFFEICEKAEFGKDEDFDFEKVRKMGEGIIRII